MPSMRGEIEVKHHEVKDFDAQQVERPPSIVAAVDAVCQVSQAACDRVAQRLLVFDDQNTHNSLLAHSKSRLTRILWSIWSNGRVTKGVVRLFKAVKPVVQVALLIVGIAMVCFGAMRGEADAVLAKAIRLCLECIGIG